MQLKSVKTGQLVKDNSGYYIILGVSMIVTKANFVGCDEEARFYCLPEQDLDYTKVVNVSDATIKSNLHFEYVSAKYEKDVVKWLTKSMLQSDRKTYFIEDYYEKLHNWYLDVYREKSGY